MRRGVWLLLLGIVLAAAGAASAYAAGSTTTTSSTTTSTTTTLATTTTTTTPTTTTVPAPVYARLPVTYLSAGCVGAGDAAIAIPGRAVLAVGTPAYSRGPSAYPTKAPIVRFVSSAASGSSCTGSHVTLASASLFGGAVTARSISATHGRGSVSGLAIYGSPIALGAGHSVSVGGWAEVTAGKRVGRITAPLVVQLVQAHRGLPAGTTIAFAFGASPQVAKPRHKHHASGGSTKHAGSTKTGGSAQKTSGQGKSRHHKHPVAQPLTATPSLGYRSRHYVFPVDGGASYVDTYGAGRNDIYDGWHHGDDLFAPLGTPIVAVANGTLSLVGWNELGGWRLWLTDNKGNSFYYAHLAGYARWILKQHHVRAGQVIGFLGRTGDAFTTAPHLHFEIHPHLYVGLGYDGAVDPTRYLKLWKVEHVQARYVPQPARLKAPVGTPRQEAAVVWRQLLVARHLLHSTARAAGPVASPASPGGLLFPRPRSFLAPEISPLPLAHIRATAARVSGARDVPLLVGGPLGAVFLTSVAVGALTFRRRRRTEEAPPPAPEASS